MSLRLRILSGYLVGLTLLLLISGWALSRLYRLGSASQAILQDNYLSILAANRMIDSLERQDTASLLFLLGDKEKGLALFARYQGEFEHWLQAAEGNITLDGEAEMIDRLKSGYRRYLARFEEVKGGAPYSAIEPIFHEVREDSGRLRELNQQAMEVAGAEAQNVAHSAIGSVAGAMLLTCVLGYLGCLTLADHITAPLLAMCGATEQIAEGRFEVDLPDSGSGEISRLAHQIRSMARNLKSFHELNVDRLIREKERTEALLDAIADGVLLVDTEMRIEAGNPAALRILGSKTEDLAPETEVKEVCRHSELLELIESGLAGTAAQAPLLVEIEDRYYQAVVSPVPAGLVLLLADVTHLKELDRLKTKFLMTASHELRTPVTGLAMTVGLLAEQPLSPQAHSMVEIAQGDVERLRKLVNELLDLSRLQGSKNSLTLTSVEAGSLIQPVLAGFRHEADRLGIELRSHIEEGLAPVLADPDKLSMVLANLISNALRYTDSGDFVEIGAIRRHDEVEIYVEDSGVGIEPEFLGRLFEPFSQSGPRERAGGAGLGLALCSEAIKAHGSEIRVCSTPGQGTRFCFTLNSRKDNNNNERPHQ